MVRRILKGFLALFRNIPLLRPFQGCSIVRPRVLLDSMFLIPRDCNCLWQELSQSCRFPSVEVCEGAKTTLRSLPPGIPRANPPADNVYEFSARQLELDFLAPVLQMVLPDQETLEFWRATADNPQEVAGRIAKLSRRLQTC